MSLTLKQERFVSAYLGEAKGNGAAAARVAGYSRPYEAAYDNLKHPDIRAAIDERLAVEALTAAESLAELSRVAMAPVEAFMQVIRPADETGAAMTVRLDYSAKLKALELLGKYLGLWKDKTEHSGNVTVVREYTDGDDVRERLKAKLDQLAERRRQWEAEQRADLPAPQGGY
jgi:phage terminase small subunit